MKIRSGYTLKLYFVNFTKSANFGGSGLLVSGQQVYCISRACEHSRQLIEEYYSHKGILVRNIILVGAYVEADAIFELPELWNSQDSVIGYHRGIVA